MNTIKYSTIIGLGVLLGLSTVSCKNQDKDFPDYQLTSPISIPSRLSLSVTMPSRTTLLTTSISV